MKTNFLSSSDLLQVASEEKLYKKLVLQLNKDLKLANHEEEFALDISAEKLKRDLHEIIYILINERFADYLNFLYIIDVPEKQVKSLDGNDVVQLSEEVTFLVLKREWQKVWFKNKYK
ncbi:hypothetical protein HX109_05860 [Galbibacter sp. BG1]|uniref:hypothetical protein n=1 Tax=Galbibacter sp. BG1 TaxID=1170699 RepID=UPI0015C0338B|nr:hypothetical protein [Galbibacter sp. BG1]QLE01112.1 hypothetical protein HX109_05860 [Galbibacter sp. BG1]